MLYIFGGLPGTGKSELSKYLSETIGAVYLRVDTIEQTLKSHGINQIYDEGYKIASSVASDNLKLGQSVVADSTNPVNESRELWRNTATRSSAQFIEIEDKYNVMFLKGGLQADYGQNVAGPGDVVSASVIKKLTDVFTKVDPQTLIMIIKSNG